MKTKRKKEYPRLLTPEQTAGMTREQVEVAEARERERLRGQRRRAEEKSEEAAAASQDELNAAKSFPEYWAAQRANLIEAQRAKYEARESDVLDLEFAMKKYINGNYDETTDPENRVPLEAIIEEVREEIATHGLCESIVLVVPKLWATGERNLRESILAKGGATALLLQYGYRTAIDGLLYERFYQKFIVERYECISNYVVMQCACNTPFTSKEAMRISIAEGYRQKGIPWLCARCRSKETSSRAEATKILTGHRSPENILHDDWGRVKSQ